MDNEHFPHAEVTEKEKYFRDIYFLNYHINHDKWDWFKFLDIVDAHRYLDDFDVYDTDDWTVTTTEAGGGNATEALTDLVNGVLLITNDAADNDCDELSLKAESYQLKVGYPLYFEIRAKASDVLQSDIVAGLVDGVSYFGGQSLSGVWFLKKDGDPALYGVVSHAGVETETDLDVDGEDLTWIRLGFHYDGAGTVRFFVIQDGDPAQTVLSVHEVTTNLPNYAHDLRVLFGIRNGEAVAKALYVDYIKCVQRRVI